MTNHQRRVARCLPLLPVGTMIVAIITIYLTELALTKSKWPLAILFSLAGIYAVVVLLVDSPAVAFIGGMGLGVLVGMYLLIGFIFGRRRNGR